MLNSSTDSNPKFYLLFTKFSKPSFKLKRKKISLFFFAVGLFGYAALSYSLNERYVLCGPDEDGCSKDIYPYCFCIPYDEINADKSYCLSFDSLTCTPLTQAEHCERGFVFKNQTSCLATVFQSTPEPPCRVVKKKFCLENHMSICENLSKGPEACQQPLHSMSTLIR